MALRVSTLIGLEVLDPPDTNAFTSGGTFLLSAYFMGTGGPVNPGSKSFSGLIPFGFVIFIFIFRGENNWPVPEVHKTLVSAPLSSVSLLPNCALCHIVNISESSLILRDLG